MTEPAENFPAEDEAWPTITTEVILPAEIQSLQMLTSHLTDPEKLKGPDALTYAKMNGLAANSYTDLYRDQPRSLFEERALLHYGAGITAAEGNDWLMAVLTYNRSILHHIRSVHHHRPVDELSGDLNAARFHALRVQDKQRRPQRDALLGDIAALELLSDIRSDAAAGLEVQTQTRRSAIRKVGGLAAGESTQTLSDADTLAVPNDWRPRQDGWLDIASPAGSPFI